METPLQYKARILALMEGKEPIAVQADTYHRVAALVHEASPDALRTRPAVDRWSVAEILAHLAEGEVVSTWRYRQMLEHNGCSLPGYPQDPSANPGQYPPPHPPA